MGLMDFAKRYAKLNKAQKEAVDTIDGPVMVIAGPGTGKTELLGVRVANILQQTDMQPENILCLTYTDSGVNAMRKRLVEIIGIEAHKVGVYTFHSFCADVINQNPDFFYNGASRKLADKITINEILTNIFAKLSHNDPMSSINNGEFTQIKTAINTISDIKRSGLAPDDLLAVLDANDNVITDAENILVPIFDLRMDKKLIPQIEQLIPRLADLPFECNVLGIRSLGQILSDSLSRAIDEAKIIGKATPLSKWKSDFLTNNAAKKRVLKSRENQIKLRSICNIYRQYLDQMELSDLYDYDDMILQVVQKIEQNDNLKLNLQEKYQYIMVDEFQDTNMSQMLILHNLTDNEINGDMPNILIVGDDDQAIYSFQGADISNILDFKKNYPQAKIITLSENYRSNDLILGESYQVISQSIERLENNFDTISKRLNANHSTGDGVSIHEANNIPDENYWIANNILKLLDKGEKPSEIAIIARNHQQIIDILPYLYDLNIPVNYEKSNNALDQEPIIYIEKLAKLLVDLSQNNLTNLNATLPEILSHPSWSLPPLNLWELGVKAYENKNQWLKQMQIMPEFAEIFNWIIQVSALVANSSLEKILDIIIGIQKPTEDSISSPLYKYYFSKEKLAIDPEIYITYLESLRAIRKCVTDYQPNIKPNLATLVKVISSYRKINEAIPIKQDFALSDKAINLLTAHSSKGLEFNNVYILDATNENWNKNRGSHGNISYPENLQIGRAGNSDDEKTRLFFVAMTRAKHQLHICYSLQNNNSKPASLSAFMANTNLSIQKIEPASDIKTITEIAQLKWYQPIISPITISMRDALKNTLSNYKLNPTALNNFVDLVNCGPENFLMNNLLHFPQAQNPFTTYGNCIHETLKKAHIEFSANNTISKDFLIKTFTDEITKTHLSDDEINKYTSKGIDSLVKFFAENQNFFHSDQKTEENFSGFGCNINDALITGKIDLIDIDKANKQITVWDYKTGKQFDNWEKGNDKIKAHKNLQQLMFYKLLVETSSQYRGYTVTDGIIQFIDPDKSGEINNISTNFKQLEIDNLSKLIKVVYDKIINLDLPDTSQYPKNLDGIKQFEQDLIDNKI